MRTRILPIPTALLSHLLPVLLLACLRPLPVANAGVEAILGHYTGAWTNLTFGSTGKAVIDMSAAGTSATILFDMDGFVFGAFDPPVINMPGTVVGNTIQIDSKGQGLFGDISGAVDAAAGTFRAVLTNIPGGFIRQVTATGTVAAGVMKLDYVVDFPGPAGPQNPARGVMTVAVAKPLAINSIVREGNEVVVSWTGGAAPYRVQTRSSLTGGNWADTGPTTTGTTARIPAPATGAIFVRVASP